MNAAHTLVKDESKNKFAASLNLEKDGMPTREELLKNMGYTNLNIISGLLQDKNHGIPIMGRFCTRTRGV